MDSSSIQSPLPSIPIVLRAALDPECNQSECFLFSYDIHRVCPTKERPPRMGVDPLVKVAYDSRWYALEKEVMDMPRVKWWLRTSASNSADRRVAYVSMSFVSM